MTMMLNFVRISMFSLVAFAGAMFAPVSVDAGGCGGCNGGGVNAGGCNGGGCNEGATYDLSGYTSKQLSQAQAQIEANRASFEVAKEAYELYKAELAKQVKSKEGDEAKAINAKIANVDTLLAQTTQGLTTMDSKLTAIKAEIAKRTDGKAKSEAKTDNAAAKSCGSKS
ncbi:MAG: hypothetical protein L6Q71_07835 [Planctomycetes bacterium]|nr:hypothetical protein [Planctomycetota bacterium]NUQ34166.1 hypothetical protein [Planctomycetaceae bacterium]